jgi:1-deoxy-D-xylulose-5-phosphate reductoisomerase
MTRALTLLGATGSIGTTALSIIRQHPERFRVEALTGSSNAALLIAQAREFRPRYAAIANPDKYAELQEGLAGTGIECGAGEQAVVEAATRPEGEIVLSGITGLAGLPATFAAAQRGAVIALANKECLVSAGEILREVSVRHGATLLPVDSEHSAIAQVFEDKSLDSIEHITLTASGGPFLRLSKEELAHVTPEQALQHPNWRMGKKITIDSATLMNKGLEVIEAWHFFPLRAEQMRVLIHPQSIVHGLVHYVDGSVLAQLSLPDMATSIARALHWPERLALAIPKLDLAALGTLTFEEPDTERFPCLRLAYAALKEGGGAPAILNAANEVAVAAFLERRIGFPRIPELIDRTLETLSLPSPHALEEVLEIDRRARDSARKYV